MSNADDSDEPVSDELAKHYKWLDEQYEMQIRDEWQEELVRLARDYAKIDSEYCAKIGTKDWVVIKKRLAEAECALLDHARKTP